MSAHSTKAPRFALIIEDDKDSARLYSRILESLDIVHDISYTWEEGYMRLQIIVPDLVVLDLRLGDKDGAELLKKIREEEEFKKTKVIVVSAYSELLSEIKHHVDQALLKPIDAKDLRKSVEKMFE